MFVSDSESDEDRPQAPDLNSESSEESSPGPASALQLSMQSGPVDEPAVDEEVWVAMPPQQTGQAYFFSGPGVPTQQGLPHGEAMNRPRWSMRNLANLGTGRIVVGYVNFNGQAQAVVASMDIRSQMNLRRALVSPEGARIVGDGQQHTSLTFEAVWESEGEFLGRYHGLTPQQVRRLVRSNLVYMRDNIHQSLWEGRNRSPTRYYQRRT